MKAHRSIRFWLPVAWVVATVVLAATVGVATSHDLIFVWLGLGMAAFSATDLRHRIPRLVLEWAPFVIVLFIYDRLRGFADGLAVSHAHAAADPRRERALRHTGSDGAAAEPPLARRASPALVGLRDLVHLPDALLRDADRGARVLWTWFHDRFCALRDDGVRPRAHRLRDLRRSTRQRRPGSRRATAISVRRTG